MPRSSSSRTHGKLILRNIRLGGTRRTTVRFDSETLAALLEIGRREGLSLSQIGALIHARKPPRLSFSVALRMVALRYFRLGMAEIERIGQRPRI